MKIVVASDSFKGTMSAVDACRAIASGVAQACPSAEIVQIPVADGGEGTVDAFVGAGAQRVYVDGVADALGRKRRGCYCILADGETAVVESAEAVGITHLLPEERNVMAADSQGLATLFDDAVKRGCRNILVGLGGSATNDGGLGLLAGLGYVFKDAGGVVLHTYGGGALSSVAEIDGTYRRKYLDEVKFTVLCDVDATFCGDNGAACVFARQKGADDNDILLLDKGMRSFAEVVRKTTGVNIAELPGAGAAGGLGGAFAAFMNARLLPGIDTVLRVVGFDDAAEGADYVITGEGAIDAQSLMGKVTVGVLSRCRDKDVKVIVFAGRVENKNKLLSVGFADVTEVAVPEDEKEKALEPSNAFENLKNTVSSYFTQI